MKIKYDRRVMRIILITAVVVSVPTLAGMICGVFFDDVVSTFCDVMMVTSVITFCPMAGLWIACMDGDSDSEGRWFESSRAYQEKIAKKLKDSPLSFYFG